MTNVAVLLFNICRYKWFVEVEQFSSVYEFLTCHSVVLGQVLIPLMMMGLYYLSGVYYQVQFKSRLDEAIKTFITTALGSLIIYFAVLANDLVNDLGEIYEMAGMLWLILMICVYLPRLFITLTIVKRVHHRRMGFNTLIIGTGEAARDLVNRLNTMRYAMGFNIVGYVATDNDTYYRAKEKGLTVYTLEELAETVKRENVVKLIVMPHHNGMNATMQLISRLYRLDISMYVSPLLFRIISSRASFDNIAGEPLIDISKPQISPATASCKRAADIVCSALALLILSPLLIAIAIAVKIGAPKASILYKQERIGYRKSRFNIIKFRTMKAEAEEDGPALSSPNDPRVTRVGRFLRKYRLDELPQFWNVIRGQMSIVGPRPEREYYVKQIVAAEPRYMLIHNVRPGITSWGMVKFGYATTVSQMVERLQYDLIYIDNLSFGVDMKIILYTVKTVLTGKGV